MDEPGAEWAAGLAREHLEHLDQRWHHALGVVDAARELAPILRPGERRVLIAAAYLHDIGYAPLLAATRFHPLDGGRYLRSLGHERLACLVAHHSGARAEAEERGLSRELAEFPEEESLVARALTYCDVITNPAGVRVDLEVRLRDLSSRYDAGSPVARAVALSVVGFRGIVNEFDGILRGA